MLLMMYRNSQQWKRLTGEDRDYSRGSHARMNGAERHRASCTERGADRQWVLMPSSGFVAMPVTYAFALGRDDTAWCHRERFFCSG